MILTEVTANPWVYVHGVWGAMLSMFAMFFNKWGTARGTNLGCKSELVAVRSLRHSPDFGVG
jgi:hypothetical protein